MSFENSETPNDCPPAPAPSPPDASGSFQDEVNSSRVNDHHHMQPFPQAGEYVPPISTMNISPPGRVSADLPQVDIVDSQQQTTRMGAGSDSSHPGPWTTPRRNAPETTLRTSGTGSIVPTVELTPRPGKK